MGLPRHCIGQIPYSLAMQDNASDVPNGSLTLATHAVGNVRWTLEYIFLAIYLCVFSLIGIFGNIPVLIVYFHKKEQTASNTFIKALAILDLMVCTLLMPYTIVYELHLVRSDVICRSFEFIRHFIVMSSCLTLVAIGIERYIAVCRLTHRMSVQHVNRGMFCIMIISAVVSFPAPFTFAVVSAEDVVGIPCDFDHSAYNDEFCHFTYSILGKTSVLVYQGVMMMCFFVTVILIIIFYIIVYIVLWKRTKLRKRMREQSKDFSMTEQRSSECDISRNNEAWADQKPKTLNIDISKTLVQPIEMNSVSERESDVSAVRENGDRKDSKTSKRKKIKHSPSSRKYKDKLRRTVHRRTAKMLFLCTVIYIVTWLPFWFDIFGATHNLILRYLFFIGNATNPIVYGIVNIQVRKAFKKLLCGCWGSCNSYAMSSVVWRRIRLECSKSKCYPAMLDNHTFQTFVWIKQTVFHSSLCSWINMLKCSGATICSIFSTDSSMQTMYVYSSNKTEQFPNSKLSFCLI